MNRLLGIFLIVVSAASFGTLAIIGRFAYADGLDVTTMLFLRFTIAAILMFAWLVIRKEPLPRGRTLLQLAGMGGLGYVGQSFCFMSAINYASTGLVALLLYLYPVFVTILTVIFQRVKLTSRTVFALILATIGAALTANPQGGQLPGILLAISAAVIYAVYILVGTGVMQKVSAIQSSAVIFASAAVVFGIMTVIRGPHWPTTQNGWLAISGIAVIATLLPVATFLGGLKIVGATDASLLSTLEPVVTVVLAAMILGEQVQPLMIAGGVLILAAVLLIVRQPRKSVSPEPLKT
ncbi:MAG: EamA family transporter [Anaerolinea sp.]|nr:EamA family transporter [Anaerolinea sp.]